MSTTDYDHAYLPTSKAMAFLFKILIQMCPISIDRTILICAFYNKKYMFLKGLKNIDEFVNVCMSPCFFTYFDGVKGKFFL